MNKSADINTEINDTENELKRIVKQVMQEKGITNLEAYRDKFENEYQYWNAINHFKIYDNMSLNNFRIWANVLGLDFEITVRGNNSDEINPWGNEITIPNDNTTA